MPVVSVTKELYRLAMREGYADIAIPCRAAYRPARSA